MAWTQRMREVGVRLAESQWSPLRTLVGVRTGRPVAALTFDDGPDPAYTPQFLDVLDAHDVRGTFFMIGESAERHPGLVEEVADRGHCVANHTQTHPSLPQLPGRRRRWEIRRCGRSLAPHGAPLLRPPKGHQSVASRLDALLCGHDVVGWSADADDWNPHPAEWMAERLLARLAPGRIVLLHDGLWDPSGPEAADRGPVARALGIALERSPGYRFVTVPELVEEGPAIRDGWFRSPASAGRGSGAASPAAGSRRAEGPR